MIRRTIGDFASLKIYMRTFTMLAMISQARHRAVTGEIIYDKQQLQQQSPTQSGSESHIKVAKCRHITGAQSAEPVNRERQSDRSCHKTSTERIDHAHSHAQLTRVDSLCYRTPRVP